jgi:hypothetical protein
MRDHWAGPRFRFRSTPPTASRSRIPSGPERTLPRESRRCASARGLDADRRRKLLNEHDNEGSPAQPALFHKPGNCGTHACPRPPLSEHAREGSRALRTSVRGCQVRFIMGMFRPSAVKSCCPPEERHDCDGRAGRRTRPSLLRSVVNAPGPAVTPHAMPMPAATLCDHLHVRVLDGTGRPRGDWCRLRGGRGNCNHQS